MDPNREDGVSAPDRAPTDGEGLEPSAIDTSVYVEAIDSTSTGPASRRTGGRITLPALVLAVGLAFFVGVLLERLVVARLSGGQSPSTEEESGAPGGETAGGSGLGSVVTFGKVESVDGATIYVSDGRGNVTKVITTDGATFSVAGPATLSDIRPGDTVVVLGHKESDGAITVTSVLDAAPGPIPPDGSRGSGSPGGGG